MKVKAQTFKDVATVNLKTEALLAKAMIMLGVDSLEITQEDMQNARNWILGLAVGPGECKATLRDTSILGFNVVETESLPDGAILLAPEDAFPGLSDSMPVEFVVRFDTGIMSGKGSLPLDRQAYEFTAPSNLAEGCHRSHPHENMNEECRKKTKTVTEKVRRAFGLSPAVNLEEVLIEEIADVVFDRR